MRVVTSYQTSSVLIIVVVVTAIFLCLILFCYCFLFLKVVVNQDKTSKQMSALRIEIQKLTMELMEFKQVHVIQ